MQGAGIESGGGVEEDFLVLAGNTRLQHKYGAVLGRDNNGNVFREYTPALWIVLRKRRDDAVIEKLGRDSRRPILHDDGINPFAMGAGPAQHISGLMIDHYLTMHGADRAR